MLNYSITCDILMAHAPCTRVCALGTIVIEFLNMFRCGFFDPVNFHSTKSKDRVETVMSRMAY